MVVLKGTQAGAVRECRLRVDRWLSETRNRCSELGLAFREPTRITESGQGQVLVEWVGAQKPSHDLYVIFPKGEDEPVRYARYSLEDAADFPSGVLHDEETFRLLWAWLEK